MGRTSSIVKDRYNAKAYDEIKVRVDKGHKGEIQAYAAALGESLNGFIGRAIDETMERDGSGAADTTGNPLKTAETTTGVGVVSLPPDTLETAQRAAEATGETMEQFMERAVVTQAERDHNSLRLGINPAAGGKLEKEA